MQRTVARLHRSRWLVVSLVAAAVLVAGALPLVRGMGVTAQGAGASIVSPPSPAVPVCGVANPGGAGAGAFETPATYTAAPTGAGPNTVYPSTQVKSFYFDSASGDVYVRAGASIVVVNRAGEVVSTLAIPSATTAGDSLATGNVNLSVLVDPGGNVYFMMMQGYVFDLVQLSPSGVQDWDLEVPGTPNGLFAWHDAAGNWAAAYISRQSQSELVSPSGTVATGTEPVPSAGNTEWVSPAPGGGLIYNDGSYVHVLAPTGSPAPASPGAVPEFGNSSSSPADLPGAPLGFGSGGVVEADGNIYVGAAGPGLDVFSPSGVYEGEAPGNVLGDVAGSPLYYDASDQSLLFQGSDGVASVSLSALQALVTSPSAPTQDGFGDALGVGAGLSAGST
ncbi:MAG: hypothetical protein ACRDZX_17555, partial [Acidimicrobiales bacterium]